MSTPEPAYCNSSLWSKPLTPQQWTNCWNWGWNRPTTGAHSAGMFTGHWIIPVLTIAALIYAVAKVRRRKAVTAQ